MNRETRSFQIFPSVPKGDGMVRESMVAVEKAQGRRTVHGRGGQETAL